MEEEWETGSKGTNKVTSRSVRNAVGAQEELGGRIQYQPATSLVEKPRPVTIGGPRCVQSPPAAILRLVALVDPGAPRSRARSLSPATAGSLPGPRTFAFSADVHACKHPVPGFAATAEQHH